MAEENYQGSGFMQQDIPQKAPNPNTKRQKITTAIIVALIVLAGIYFIWDNFLGIQPDVKINGTQISMRNTVQDLLDDGFVLCDSNGKVSKNFNLNVGAKQVYNIDYYIGIPHESIGSYCDCSGVRITVANFDSSNKEFKDCAIYSMAYYPRFQDSGVEVLLHGEDLREASFDAWLDYFETTGYPFKKDKLEECRRGDRGLLLGKRGRYKFEANVENDYNEEENDWTDYYIFSLTFTRNVDVTYKSR